MQLSSRQPSIAALKSTAKRQYKQAVDAYKAEHGSGSRSKLQSTPWRWVPAERLHFGYMGGGRVGLSRKTRRPVPRWACSGPSWPGRHLTRPLGDRECHHGHRPMRGHHGASVLRQDGSAGTEPARLRPCATPTASSRDSGPPRVTAASVPQVGGRHIGGSSLHRSATRSEPVYACLAEATSLYRRGGPCGSDSVRSAWHRTSDECARHGCRLSVARAGSSASIRRGWD